MASAPVYSFFRLRTTPSGSGRRERDTRGRSPRSGTREVGWLFIDRAFLQKELNLLHDPIVAGLYSKIFGN